jgi:hypothetical protein
MNSTESSKTMARTKPARSQRPSWPKLLTKAIQRRGVMEKRKRENYLLLQPRDRLLATTESIDDQGDGSPSTHKPRCLSPCDTERRALSPASGSPRQVQSHKSRAYRTRPVTMNLYIYRSSWREERHMKKVRLHFSATACIGWTAKIWNDTDRSHHGMENQPTPGKNRGRGINDRWYGTNCLSTDYQHSLLIWTINSVICVLICIGNKKRAFTLAGYMHIDSRQVTECIHWIHYLCLPDEGVYFFRVHSRRNSRYEREYFLPPF